MQSIKSVKDATMGVKLVQMLDLIHALVALLDFTIILYRKDVIM